MNVEETAEISRSSRRRRRAGCTAPAICCARTSRGRSVPSKLEEGATPEGPLLLGASVGKSASAYPPTLAMKRFADSLSRKKGIKPPPGYKTSISICRKFLSVHAPKKADSKTVGKLDPKPVSPAQLLYAKKMAQRKGLIIPDDAKTNSTTMSAWINSNRDKTRRKRGRRTAYKSAGSVAPQSTAPSKRNRQPKTPRSLR